VVTWDDDKRQANLREHAIDLALCEPIFDGPLLTEEDTRERYGEQRLCTLGLLDDRVVYLVWTERRSGAHFISCRHATKAEIRKFWNEAPL
jgi:uncharacterized DUF497 family protein